MQISMNHMVSWIKMMRRTLENGFRATIIFWDMHIKTNIHHTDKNINNVIHIINIQLNQEGGKVEKNPSIIERRCRYVNCSI